MSEEVKEVVVEEPKAVEEPKVKAEPPKVEAKAEPKADPQAAPQWAKDRIAKLTARLHAERQAKASGSPAPLSPSGEAFTEAQINAMANERAQLIAQDSHFNDRCNEARSAGEAKFGDFTQKLGDLVGLVDHSDPQSTKAYRTFLETALETGVAPKIIHMMGSDLNLASRVLSLSPIKMALEVAKMAQDRGAAEPSKAPKPIQSVGSRAAQTGIKADDPDRASELSTADWMRAREAQAKERRIR